MQYNSLLEKLKSTRVLVVGDLMLDHYIWGDVHRISPEAPVPVVSANRDSYSAGGAANVALNLANLGVKTSVLGYYSIDEAGNRLAKILKESNVQILNLKKSNNPPTIIKTRVIVRGQQLCRIDREEVSSQYNVENSDGFDELLQNALEHVDAVILSDYAKGVVTQTLLNKLSKFSLKNKKFLLTADPKPSHQLLYNHIALLTPNKSEALEMAGLKADAFEKYPLEEICNKIYEIHHPQHLVITLGAQGMAICEEGRVKELIPTDAREVFDVSGAGDTVIATITAALAAGAKSSEAAHLANIAAGCVVAHMGTVPIDFDELKEAIHFERNQKQ